MINSVDPDHLASEEVNWSGSTLFSKMGHIRVQQDKLKSNGWKLHFMSKVVKFLSHNKTIAPMGYLSLPLDYIHV